MNSWLQNGSPPHTHTHTHTRTHARTHARTLTNTHRQHQAPHREKALFFLVPLAFEMVAAVVAVARAFFQRWSALGLSMCTPCWATKSCWPLCALMCAKTRFHAPLDMSPTDASPSRVDKLASFERLSCVFSSSMATRDEMPSIVPSIMRSSFVQRSRMLSRCLSTQVTRSFICASLVSWASLIECALFQLFSRRRTAASGSSAKAFISSSPIRSFASLLPAASALVPVRKARVSSSRRAILNPRTLCLDRAFVAPLIFICSMSMSKISLLLHFRSWPVSRQCRHQATFQRNSLQLSRICSAIPTETPPLNLIIV